MGTREQENVWRLRNQENVVTWEHKNAWRQENMRICDWKKFLQEIKTKPEEKKKKGHCLYNNKFLKNLIIFE